MAESALINSAHRPGLTCLAFARDGSYVASTHTDGIPPYIFPLDESTLEAVIPLCAYGRPAWVQIKNQIPL